MITGTDRPRHDDLRDDICRMAEEFDRDRGATYNISSIEKRCVTKRRRFYDVINVMVACGCCKKTSLDQVVWLGRQGIIDEIASQRAKLKIDNHHMPLDDLFPEISCIGISNLTTSFLMMFPALKTDRLDLRSIGKFLSRRSNRYRTTLCKLYQITYILSALQVITRTSKSCEVMLLDPYLPSSDVISDVQETKAVDETSIEFLLNRPDMNATNSYIGLRRQEMVNFICE